MAKKLTDEQVQEIIRLHGDELTNPQIAEQINCSITTVANVLRKFNLEKNQYTRICEICNVKYISQNKDGRFCSSKHENVINCLTCGEMFASKFGKKYCKYDCKKVAIASQKKQKPIVRRSNKYRIPVQRLEYMLSNGCEVCGDLNNLCIDHDHTCCNSTPTCGKCTRGVLCNSCNKAEGNLKGDTGIILNLYEYVLKYRNLP